MRNHSPTQQFKEARQIAADHNMFVVDKGGRFLLYRKTPARPVYLGMRADAAAFRSFVCKCANFK